PISHHDTPTTHRYTLSLHDALPISKEKLDQIVRDGVRKCGYLGKGKKISKIIYHSQEIPKRESGINENEKKKAGQKEGKHFSLSDRKSTRLNSSHVSISYAVFCLKK